MKRFLLISAFYICIILFIPYIIVRISSFHEKSATQTVSEPIEKITTCISSTGEVREIDFCEYLKGVVSAEMPASFHEEALKAQAIAARSYILTRMQGYMRDGTPPEHNGAMSCDDPSHCKAWTPTEKLKEQWGDSFDFYWDKISSCIEQTKGIVMTYDGALVNAVFPAPKSPSKEMQSPAFRVFAKAEAMRSVSSTLLE